MVAVPQCGIKADLSPSKDGAEVRKCDIPNTLDSRKMHSTMQICHCSSSSPICVLPVSGEPPLIVGNDTLESINLSSELYICHMWIASTGKDSHALML